MSVCLFDKAQKSTWLLEHTVKTQADRLNLLGCVKWIVLLIKSDHVNPSPAEPGYALPLKTV